MTKDSFPDTGEDWLSLGPNMEFQPASFAKEDPYTAATLKHAVDRILSGKTTYANAYEKQFVDGTETYYNDHAQAWRLLGFYIDCNAPRNNYNECDKGGNENNRDNNNNNNEGNNYNYYSNQAPCQRYLLWAGYVDLNYSGGGIGEYQFYDRSKKSWNTTSCVAANGRCAKMDCHLEDTNFKLLGFFKEPNYHEWMEQLFKHQGVCLWSDDEYEFMQVDRNLWPCDCTNTYSKDEKGNYLYYDTKPYAEGRIGLGLYTDSRCSQDYTGNKNVEDILKSYVNGENYDGGNGGSNDGSETAYDLASSIAEWNDAFDVFKVCQPCKAYDLGYNSDLYSSYRQGGDDSSSSSSGASSFSCYDDADYVNVNQCMKFRTKTEMLTADFRDIMLADQQGTIVEVEVMGRTYGDGGYGRSTGGTGSMGTSFNGTNVKENPPSFGMIVFFGFSLMLFVLGGVMAWRAKSAKDDESRKKALKAPLMTHEEAERNSTGVMA